LSVSAATDQNTVAYNAYAY